MADQFPAIKYEQGGRTVYAAATRLGDILAAIPERENPTVITDANRRLFPAHAREFGDYLWEVEDWLVGPLMVGVAEAVFRTARGGGLYGVLTIPDGTARHLFDGQHRVEGARNRLSLERVSADAMRTSGITGEELAAKEARITELLEAVIPTVFYVEADIGKLRQMYSDISHVRPPDAITTARFDARDPFNVAARAMAGANPLLAGRVDLERNTLPAKAEELLTLNQLATILRVCWYGNTRKHAATAEPDPADIADRGGLFFQTMMGTFPVVADIATGNTDSLTARERGDVVASVTMLRVFAAVWRHLLYTRNAQPDDVYAYFQELPAQVVPDSVYTRAGMPPGAHAPLGRQQVDAVLEALIAEFEYGPEGEDLEEDLEDLEEDESG